MREVRCTCGKKLQLKNGEPPPEVCPGCARRFIEEKPFEPRRGPVQSGGTPGEPDWEGSRLILKAAGKGLAFLFVVGFTLYGIFYPRPRVDPAPAPPWNGIPRVESLWTQYSGRTPEPVDPAADRSAITQVLERLCESQSRRDGATYVAAFNVRRMLAESERLGSSKPLTTLEAQRDAIHSIEGGFQTDLALLKSSAVSARWSRLEVRKIDFIPARGEAVASCWLTPHDDRLLWRFWLIKDPDGWRVFDVLDVDDGLRTAAGIRDTRRFEIVPVSFSLLDASNLIKQGKPAEALQNLKAARQIYEPQRLSPAIDLVEAEALLKLGKTVEAMDALEQLAETYNDRPMVHRRRAALLRAMGKEAESAAAAEEYRRRMDAEFERDDAGK